MIKTKKVNKGGGITIPSDVRLTLGIEKGSALDLEVVGGKVILSRHTPCCMFCNSREQLVRFHNKDICSKCIKEMEEQIDE